LPQNNTKHNQKPKNQKDTSRETPGISLDSEKPKNRTSRGRDKTGISENSSRGVEIRCEKEGVGERARSRVRQSASSFLDVRRQKRGGQGR